MSKTEVMTHLFLSNNIAGRGGSLTGSGPFWQCGARTKPAQDAICASTTPTSHKGNPSAKTEIKDIDRNSNCTWISSHSPCQGSSCFKARINLICRKPWLNAITAVVPEPLSRIKANLGPWVFGNEHGHRKTRKIAWDWHILGISKLE